MILFVHSTLSIPSFDGHRHPKADAPHMTYMHDTPAWCLWAIYELMSSSKGVHQTTKPNKTDSTQFKSMLRIHIYFCRLCLNFFLSLESGHIDSFFKSIWSNPYHYLYNFFLFPLFIYCLVWLILLFQDSIVIIYVEKSVYIINENPLFL